jgi:L-lactate permease
MCSAVVCGGEVLITYTAYTIRRIVCNKQRCFPMCAANSAGGVMGEMVDAQSITIATAATEQVGNEGIIFRFVAGHSAALCSIVGGIVLLYPYIFPICRAAWTSICEIGLN